MFKLSKYKKLILTPQQLQFKRHGIFIDEIINIKQMEELLDEPKQMQVCQSFDNIADFGQSWQLINVKMQQTLQNGKRSPSPSPNLKNNIKKQDKKTALSLKKSITSAKPANNTQKQNKIIPRYSHERNYRNNSPFEPIRELQQNTTNQLICKAIAPVSDKKKISIIEGDQDDESAPQNNIKIRSIAKQNRTHSKVQYEQSISRQINFNSIQQTNESHFIGLKLPNVKQKKNQIIQNVNRQFRVKSQCSPLQVNQKQNQTSNLFINCSKSPTFSANLYPSLIIHHSPNKYNNKYFQGFSLKQKAFSLQSLHERQQNYVSLAGLRIQQSQKIKGRLMSKQSRPQIKLRIGPVITKLKIIRNKNQ